jgi:hypothetical protein
MSFQKGCLKPALFGCLGILLIGILVIVISAFVAWRGLDKTQVEDQELTPVVVGPETRQSAAPGRVIVELGQGEFRIRPARPGEGVYVKARYDREVFELEDHFEGTLDSEWVYSVRFRRTMPALQALFRTLLGGKTDTYVHVYLPPDLKLSLDLLVEEGALEADLGGLWISDADIRFLKGGFELSIDEPLQEPMDRLAIRGRMGGFEAHRLGNASPRSLSVDCKMGGADIDLRGHWVQDCDIELAVRMGGMGVGIPRNVDARGISVAGSNLRRSDPEVPQPVLRFSLSQSMGEIECYRR